MIAAIAVGHPNLLDQLRQLRAAEREAWRRYQGREPAEPGQPIARTWRRAAAHSAAEQEYHRALHDAADLLLDGCEALGATLARHHAIVCDDVCRERSHQLYGQLFGVISSELPQP